MVVGNYYLFNGFKKTLNLRCRNGKRVCVNVYTGRPNVFGVFLWLKVTFLFPSEAVRQEHGVVRAVTPRLNWVF